MFNSLVIPFLIIYIVLIGIVIIWVNLLDKDKTTKEERDNTPFP
jgi:hypothetical protein